MAGVLGKAVPQANAPAPRVLGAGLPKAPGVLAKAKGGGKAGKGGGKGCKGGNIIQQGLALLQGANVNQVQQVIQGNNAAAAQVAGNLQCVGCHCFCFPGGGQQGPKWKAYQVPVEFSTDASSNTGRIVRRQGRRANCGALA